MTTLLINVLLSIMLVMVTGLGVAAIWLSNFDKREDQIKCFIFILLCILIDSMLCAVIYDI